LPNDNYKASCRHPNHTVQSSHRLAGNCSNSTSIHLSRNLHNISDLSRSYNFKPQLDDSLASSITFCLDRSSQAFTTHFLNPTPSSTTNALQSKGRQRRSIASNRGNSSHLFKALNHREFWEWCQLTHIVGQSLGVQKTLSVIRGNKENIPPQSMPDVRFCANT
jgi:hypothetical protein